ncbi:hypothetical protein PanWU01x14_094680 [Parasponia andersonii]|uniref:DUF4283 domain-containing protein n=1 Tax=Parasponia andersonii TaxID=3476 RepID=A0A2P5D5D8_PARAD|nr:hypothetical protein PanWU01x14_094680 [Parasponia andersonii]
MEEDDLTDIDLLVSQTNNMHCYDEPLELLPCEEAQNKEVQVLAVGKLLSLKPHSGNLIKTVASSMWGIPKGLKVSELERNKFTTIFPKLHDKAQVLSKEPWTINRELFVIKDVPSSMSIREDSISEANIRLIAAKIGRLVEIDKKSLGVFFSGDYSLHCYRGDGYLQWCIALYGPWLRAKCKVPSYFHKQQLIDKKTEDVEMFNGTTGAIVAGIGTGEYSRQRTQEIQRKDKGRLVILKELLSDAGSCGVLDSVPSASKLSHSLFAPEKDPYLQEESSTFEKT